MTIPTPDQMFPSDFTKLTIANSVNVLGDDGTKPGYVNVGELISTVTTSRYVANGSTTSRSLVIRGGDVINLLDHGGVLDGLFNNDAALNEARAAAGPGGVVYVPAGQMLYFTIPTSGGSAPVIWKFDGTTLPGGSPITEMGHDIIESNLGGKYFGRGTTAPDCGPVVRIDNTLTSTNGTPGFVVPTLAVNTTVPANALPMNNYAWGIVSTLNSYAIGPAENVAIAGYVHKKANGSEVWAENLVATDDTGNPSSLSGATVGSEIDLAANGDDNGGIPTGTIPTGSGIRVIQDLVAVKQTPSGTDAVIGWGSRVGGGGGGVTIKRGYSVTGVILNAAFSTEFATLLNGANAYRMGTGQTFAFDGAGRHTLSYDGTCLQYGVAGVSKVSISDEGVMSLSGSQVLTTTTTTAFGSAMASWWGSLPTTLPTTTGKPWNDGGVLSWT